MNILRVDFAELYRRHLCRHSQPGINVAHLGSVAITYFGGFLLIAHLLSLLEAPPWLLPAALVPYFVVLACNLPVRLLAVSVLGFASLLAAVFLLPPLPTWLALPLSAVLIVLGHKSQAWSHRIWTEQLDMAEFTTKYKKGLALFLLLSVYELPILLNYLVFVRRHAPSAAACTNMPLGEHTARRPGELVKDAADEVGTEPVEVGRGRLPR
jgi:hypothetical protein